MPRLAVSAVSLAAVLNLAVVSSQGTLAAQTPSPTPSRSPGPPPCSGAEHRQFDFWLGEWEVRNPAGQAAGTNRITSEFGGCVLQERWQGRGGLTGSSFNTYSAADGKWHQVWVDSAGSFLLLTGQATPSGMAFTGDMPTARGGRVQHRLTFEKLAGDRIRQLWQTSGDGGSTWQVVFDGTYVRRSAGVSPSPSPSVEASFASPCAADPAYRRLDFWLGRWDVSVGGRHVGVDSVERVLGGCAVAEHWTDAAGGEGQSLFFRDPGDGSWKQVWVTDRGPVKEKRLLADFPDGVRFQGEAVTAGGRLPDRTTLTPLSDGMVRQVIEQSEDGGRTWVVRFDAVHRRQD